MLTLTTITIHVNIYTYIYIYIYLFIYTGQQTEPKIFEKCASEFLGTYFLALAVGLNDLLLFVDGFAAVFLCSLFF